MIDMAGEDIYQHNLRLNLNNPKHLKIHKKLLGFNKEVYKSKNDYIVKMVYEGMFGDNAIMDKDVMEELEERIIQKVTTRLLQTLINGGGMNVSISTPEKKEAIDEEVTSAALGYFDDDWSDCDED